MAACVCKIRRQVQTVLYCTLRNTRHIIFQSRGGESWDGGAYWERTLKRMTEADERKQDIEKNFWSAEFMGAQQTRQLMDKYNMARRRFLGAPRPQK